MSDTDNTNAIPLNHVSEREILTLISTRIARVEFVRQSGEETLRTVLHLDANVSEASS